MSRTKFSFEDVLAAAYGILRRSGRTAVTSRAIAKALGSSTMPVYSALGSMTRLEKALKTKAFASFADFQTRPYTPNVLLNIAVGQVLFARDEPQLYRFLHLDRASVLNSPEHRVYEREVERRLGTPIPFAAYLDRATLENLDDISLNVWLFTHGLSMAVMDGLLGKITDRRIIALLQGAGGAFVTWEQTKKKSAKETRR